MQLVVEVYNATATFPDAERFGLTSQMRRSAVSIPSNIAEGAGRESQLDFKRFLSISLSSANELYTQVMLSEMLQLLSEENSQKLKDHIEYIQKMINKLLQSVSNAMNKIE